MKSYQIKVQPENRTIVGKEGEPILETAIRNKVNIKVGCKGGGCGICKIQILEGEVDQGICSRSVLPLSEVEQGYALACQARPKSDITIQYHSFSRSETSRGTKMFQDV